MRGGFGRAEDDLSLFQDMRSRGKKPSSSELLPLQGFLVQHGNGEQRKAMAHSFAEDDMLFSDAEGKNDYDWLLTPPETPILSMDLDFFHTGTSSSDAPHKHAPSTDPPAKSQAAASHSSVDAVPMKPSPKRSLKLGMRHSSPEPPRNAKLDASSSDAHVNNTNNNKNFNNNKSNNKINSSNIKTNSSSSNNNNNNKPSDARANARSSWPSAKPSRSSWPSAKASPGGDKKRPDSPLVGSRAPATSSRRARQSAPSPEMLQRSSSANEATMSSSPSRCAAFPSSASTSSPMMTRMMMRQPTMGTRRSSSSSRAGSVGVQLGHSSEPSGGAKPKKGPGHFAAPAAADGGARAVKSGGKPVAAAPAGLGSRIREKISQNLRRMKPSALQGEAHTTTAMVKKALKPTLWSNNNNNNNNNKMDTAKCGHGWSLQASEAAFRRTDDACKGGPSAAMSGLRAFMSNMSMASLQSIGCSKRGEGSAAAAGVGVMMMMSSCSSSSSSSCSVDSSPMETSSTASTVIDPDGSISSSSIIDELSSRASMASRNDFSSPDFSMYTKEEGHITNWLDDGDGADDGDGDDDDYDCGEEQVDVDMDMDMDILRIFELRIAGLSSSCGAESPLVNELDGSIEVDPLCLDSMPW